jgi:hypothetical protein
MCEVYFCIREVIISSSDTPQKHRLIIICRIERARFAVDHAAGHVNGERIAGGGTARAEEVEGVIAAGGGGGVVRVVKVDRAAAVVHQGNFGSDWRCNVNHILPP